MAKQVKDKPKKKRMPTVVQVQLIWDQWDKYDDDATAIKEFASKLKLDPATVKQIVSLSRKLVVASPSVQFSAGVCPVRGSVRDIVKCAAAARGMILGK
jgi:hypothetical protein